MVSLCEEGILRYRGPRLVPTEEEIDRNWRFFRKPTPIGEYEREKKKLDDKIKSDEAQKEVNKKEVERTVETKKRFDQERTEKMDQLKQGKISPQEYKNFEDKQREARKIHGIPDEQKIETKTPGSPKVEDEGFFHSTIKKIGENPLTSMGVGAATALAAGLGVGYLKKKREQRRYA